MSHTKPVMKQIARTLRSTMTEHEHILWYNIRRKQIHGIQFYRQKVLGPFIVDFYAPSIRLVIELDGSQHNDPPNKAQDQYRDHYLSSVKIKVVRISNLDIKENLNGVLNYIEKLVLSLKTKSPRHPSAVGPL